ncbi:MAG: hypothetical protein BWY62_00405 [Firmicutes bacterium ADurb.Bin356]|nr:MAG: hypothetical protein BWY62_00405 [Firmicutes bacterium ADurb.Bin356]
MESFTGFTEETYRFFWELAFRNETEFFNENRTRYEREVKAPLNKLALALSQTALLVDSSFNVRPAAVVSRIRRDTRFSKDKTLYRDHAFLVYKHYGQRTSESYVLYAEFERNAYGYGMGMYGPQTALMNAMHKRMLNEPELFLSLVNEPAFKSRFSHHGVMYKRPRFTSALKELQPWLNMRSLSFGYSSDKLQNTFKPGLVDEIKEGFMLLKPVYRFIMGLEQ